VLEAWVSAHPAPGPAAELETATIAGVEIATCVQQREHEKHLVCVAVGEGPVVLDCRTSTAWFEDYRPLFLFVARSLRVGPAAAEGLGEEIEVCYSEL
jgi:hypothetical protein